MPYINKNAREKFDNDFSGDQADNAGELNYMFTTLILEYINKHGLNYQRINDVVGALEGAKLEFYRRMATPYEEEKIEENGDIYETDRTESDSKDY